MSSTIQPVKLLAGFSWGRWLGSWLGMALMPLFPMLNWIFEPYFSLKKMLAHGATLETLDQYQAALNHLGANILWGRILPLLLLCLAFCMMFSWAFGMAGAMLEQRL